IRAYYRLPQTDVRGLSHDLAYRGLESRSLDLTDLYSTDAEIVHYDLTTLEDDARFFPAYDAIIVCRDDVPEEIRASLNRLEGRIDEAAMTRMNARAALDRQPETRIASRFLREQLDVASDAKVQSRAARIWQRTREHLAMVGISLGLAVLVAVPLGIIAFYRPGVGRVVFTIADVLQTLPALAVRS